MKNEDSKLEAAEKSSGAESKSESGEQSTGKKAVKKKHGKTGKKAGAAPASSVSSSASASAAAPAASSGGSGIVSALSLRRSAREVKRSVILRRIFAVLLAVLVSIIAVVYAVSYFYDKFGSFTVKINKYDMVRQGLSLSETPEFDRTTSRLNADIVYDMTNISGEDLPENIDKINGSHNGDSYIAYTFYLSNSGEDTLTYEGELTMESVTGGVDEAIRVAVFLNGERTVYGKTKSNGGGIEGDCDKEFASSTIVAYEKHESFHPGESDKYTVVIWLEGNDPDCTDSIIGGTMKLGMNFKIIENT